CIRKANVGLEALENGMMISASNEEKNLIAGQLYFFRAWWHFEMINWFGGLPYIDKAFEANEQLDLPRLTYQQCADKCAEDFRKAADLLPVNWDDTSAGKATSGKNMLRINKVMALAYLGKCYLWAGSPLMEHGAQLGAIQSGRTYQYNTDYMNKAADALGELLALVEAGQTQYSLAEYNFENVYTHEKSKDATTRFSDNFYTRKQNWLMPGTVEAIFRGPSSDFNGSHWNTTKVFGPKVAGLVEHDNVIHQPTANAVNMYGMANGLPLDDPDSGFDPNFPFKDRDPRFYHDIVFDGFQYLHGAAGDREAYVYCQLYTGGNMRPVANGSRTGYFIQKLVPHTCNVIDRDYDWGSAVHVYLPYMRLADVYLMYAEAAAAKDAGFSRTNKSSKCNLTSVDAINKVRARCGAGEVHAKFTGNAYMDEIRRERAVELMFEGHRFNDLQRWLLLTEAPYTIKTSQEFDRVLPDDWYTSGKNDPRDAQVANFREEVILERVFGTKHYWFPLPDSEVYLYADFPQNPGW
ncbi:MAG: RagB/SusD family nutrient uptake outer membrane protein, partial [Bacteroidales bacterium]|nr:RagB/SusD family nutrient uptake outer membrane protein [Bacteroidales bacterium]